MSEYMSIGKVSKLKNVSIKSLRYYDKIGILKPAFVNEETNYRYYTQEQLYLLDAITLCIKLGIPLKNLKQYVENNTINLQKLLYDGKILAEEKILEIHKCLEALQDTLQKLSVSGIKNGCAKIPESKSGKSGTPLPDDFCRKSLAVRTILAVPLEEMDTPKYYGQYILKLFVTAQQKGLTVSYPSGVLHEYQNGSLKRYMFLTLDANSLSDADSLTPSASSLQTDRAADTDSLIRTLPAGDYCCRRLTAHITTSAQEEMQAVLQTDSFCVLETDTSSEQNKKEGYPFELQYLA